MKTNLHQVFQKSSIAEIKQSVSVRLQTAETYLADARRALETYIQIENSIEYFIDIYLKD